MNIDELTVGQFKELHAIFSKLETKDSVDKKQMHWPGSPLIIGEKYFIRTVTYHAVGRLKAIVGPCYVLENSSWVADSGRFHNALRDGRLSEVEPIIGDHFIFIAACVDAMEWSHPLPDKQI